MYAKYIKRIIDFFLSLMALFVLFPVLLILTITGAVAMGGNPFFVQPRPGVKDKNGNEKIFYDLFGNGYGYVNLYRMH